MSYIVVTKVPLNDSFVNEVKVFDNLEHAKYYKWKQDAEYTPSRLYKINRFLDICILCTIKSEQMHKDKNFFLNFFGN